MQNKSLTRKPPAGRARRQGGYMLFDVVVWIGIAAILLGAFYQISATFAENRRIAGTGDGISLISEALYNYRMQERRWPASMGDLAGYAPNLSSGMKNGFGQPYTLAPPAVLTDPVAPITVHTTLPSEDIAENVVRQFYGRGTRTGTRISVEVPIPGHEPARDALLARDGTRDMDGDLDMDSHDLQDVGGITARTLSASSNISVGGSTLSGNRVSLLNQIAALNCTGSQRVMISGGSARCQAVTSTGTSGGSGTSGSSSCRGASPSDCRCAGDLYCRTTYTGCSCSCMNQCGR